MSGKKRLMQSMAVAGLTGVLAITASFSQVPNLQLEETVRVADSGRAGVVIAFAGNDVVSNVWTKELSLEQTDVNQVGASGATTVLYELAGVTEGSNSEDTEDTAKETKAEDTEEASEETKTGDSKEVPEETKAEDTKEASEETKAEDTKEASEETKAEDTKEASEETKAEDTEETAKETNAENTEGTAKETKAENAEETAEDTKTKNTKGAAKVKEEGTEKEEKEKTKAEKKEKTDTKEEKTKEEKTKEEGKEKDTKQASQQWENKLMASVKDFLYIRESNSKDSEILGKLRKGDAAKVIKKGKTWTKIKSGSVTGYVKNEFCVYGEKAYELAKKICDTYATAETSGLRVRTNANKKSNIIKVVEEGTELVVNTDAKEKEGWVAVSVGDSEGYVSEEYVTVALGTSDAISLEEEQKILAEQKKAEEEAAAQAAAQQAASAAVQNAPAAASGNELSLLAAIIFCEAGGESYTGQVAVGAVVLNRVRSGSFPGSIASVIQQSGQFSPVASGAFSSALANGSYQNCISAAQAALAGSDPTGGALYFHRYGGGAGLVIGNHVFY